MQFPYFLSDNSIVIFINGEEFSADRSNPYWDKIKAEISRTIASEQLLKNWLSPINYVAEAVKDDRNINVRNGYVFFGDERVHESLAKRLLDVINQKIDLTPWTNFVRNVFANPSPFARQELYDWLERADLPITPEGHFLAYKIVGANYRDLHSGKFDNSVGKVVEMKRSDVDDDRNRTCSRGLHFCSKGYLGSYGTGRGSKVMIVKVNPADVVAIPNDHNFAKGRTWKYEVVSEMPREQAAAYVWNAVHDYSDPEGWDEYTDDEDYDEEYSY